MMRKNIEVCFSPALFEFHKNTESIVVVVDILRATSSICTGFSSGVRSIIPVETSEEARRMKDSGYTVAGERNGIVLDFADFGNSPFNFSPENVKGKDIAYTTTNGTRTIHLAASCFKVAIGSFLNNDSLIKWVVSQERDVVILCAGWKNKYNLEDSVYAGCLAEGLISTGKFHTDCDSTHASIDLWKHWKDNLRTLLEKSAQRWRLQKNNLDDCIDYCLQLNKYNVVPVLDGNKLVDAMVNE